MMYDVDIIDEYFSVFELRAALLLGFWDLLIHSAALCALIFMFGRTSHPMHTFPATNDQQSRQLPIALVDPYEHPSAASNNILNNKNFFSSNTLLNRILEKHNENHPGSNINSKNFYSHMDLMTVNWAQSLSQPHICGVLTNKPSYIVPYFLIKVFNVIVSILSMLGFYAYLPDIKIWLRMQPEFPFKNYLLDLDGQTLQLVVFTLLLFIILAKLYIAAIVWYCYGYITALNMARTIGTITAHADGPHPIIGGMYSPPKYEEAIKSNPHQEEDYAPPPYTPLLST
ncbi:hypothetical protein I4U23_012548 [Adineta vaga]|nr:hypothetical protein I4U23_012548 [Adineta vaga]